MEKSGMEIPLNFSKTDKQSFNIWLSIEKLKEEPGCINDK